MFRTPLQQQWQSYNAGWQLHVPCRQSSKHFISGQLKVIPLFRYSVIPYSAFYSVPKLGGGAHVLNVKLWGWARG